MASYDVGQHAQGLQMNYQQDFAGTPATETIDYNHSSPAVQTTSSAAPAKQQYQSSGNVNKTNLIINYLPQTMTDGEFEELFRTIGPIKSYKVCRDRKTNYSYGYGFVDYFSPEDAEQAIKKLNGLPIKNKCLKVSLSREGDKVKGANLYITNLPKSLTEGELNDVFKGYGSIIQYKILRDATGLSKGAGFILFDKKPEAEAALAAMNGKAIPGYPENLTIKFAEDNANKVRPPAFHFGHQQFCAPGPERPPMNRFVNRFNPMQPPNFGQQRMIGTGPGQMGNLGKRQEGHTLFVYNIGPHAMEADVYQLFEPYGAVLKIDIIWDSTKNQGKGFCFVTMADLSDAERALSQLNGYHFINKPLQVSFKKPKKT